MIIRNLMHSFVVLPFIFVSLAVAQDADEPLHHLDDQPIEAVDLDNGEDIFNHQWSRHEATVDGGDGLGPLHNDVSCAACHFQGGIGGGGTVDKNAVVLSLDATPKGMSPTLVLENAKKIHPGFVSELPNRFLQMIRTTRKMPIRNGAEFELTEEQIQQIAETTRPSTQFQASFVLHKLSTNEEYSPFLKQFSDYTMPTSSVAPTSIRRQLATEPVRAYDKPNKMRVLISQRNSPALFGVGLIDKIDIQALTKIQQEQRKRGLVSGRATQGKFGWKAQTRTLAQFVQGACANELGLNVPGAVQPADPSRTKETVGLDLENQSSKNMDLTSDQLTMLTSFVAELPQPSELKYDQNESMAKIAKHGKQMFAEVGCAECHRESIETKTVSVKGIYSDLLLHDVGANLSDPVPSGPSAGAAYYGGGISPGSLTSTRFGEEPANKRENTRSARVVSAQREWRTPPLWGVSETAPYLHDGRASSINEAILYHGGEAKFSVKRFVTLAPKDRLALLSFLDTLVPPEGEEI